MWTFKEVSHPKQELLLISFCLFLCCCCLLFCCCFFFLLLFFLFFLWWHYTCILSVKDNILNESFEMELLRGNCIIVNQLASTIVSQLFQCIHVLFFLFLVVFFWCLILLILKSLQELLLIMSFSQFHFFPVWMHIFMLSFFPFPAIFTFISRRHRGSPFGLTFYIDGMQDIRLSCCCEYKHKPGHVLGGRNGHFQFVVVEGAAPCYR